MSGTKTGGGTGGLTPELGCAGLAIAAARRDGDYTEIEGDRANAALMKLLMLPRPGAAALRKDAEALRRAGTPLTAFANAAKTLPKDNQERLVTQLWLLLGERAGGARDEDVMRTVMFAFGMDENRVDGLRPVL